MKQKLKDDINIQKNDTDKDNTIDDLLKKHKRYKREKVIFIIIIIILLLLFCLLGYRVEKIGYKQVSTTPDNGMPMIKVTRR